MGLKDIWRPYSAIMCGYYCRWFSFFFICSSRCPRFRLPKVCDESHKFAIQLGDRWSRKKTLPFLSIPQFCSVKLSSAKCSAILTIFFQSLLIIVLFFARISNLIILYFLQISQIFYYSFFKRVYSNTIPSCRKHQIRMWNSCVYLYWISREGRTCQSEPAEVLWSPLFILPFYRHKTPSHSLVSSSMDISVCEFVINL